MKTQENTNENNILKLPLIILICLLLIDQISKIIAIKINIDINLLNNILKFKLTYNNGIAFGVGQNNSVGTFIISNIIILGIIMRFMYMQKGQMNKLTIYSLVLILSRRHGKSY